MLSSIGATGIGVLMLVLFAVFYFLSILATTRAVLAFVGMCLIGTAGFLGGVFHDIATWLANLANSATSWGVGVGVGGTALVIITGVIFIHDLMPKHTAGKRTGWAGIGLAALLIAGVSGIAALNNIPSGVVHGVTNAKTTLQQSGG
jgi:hypothetical protein